VGGRWGGGVTGGVWLVEGSIVKELRPPEAQWRRGEWGVWCQVKPGAKTRER